MSIRSFFAPRKRKLSKVSVSSGSNKPERDNLVENEVPKELNFVGTEGLAPSWRNCLQAQFRKQYFAKLTQFVSEEREVKTVFPAAEFVHSYSWYFPIKEVKAVIVGQDPYHGTGQAHGLCFSVLPGVKVPPSLQNIFKELKSDIPGFHPPDHGYLVGWASQGVLLLNACLTVEAHKPNSHKDKGWETYTDSIISWMNLNLKNVVFILWGSYAHKKGLKIDQEKHLVLKSAHPSPYSADRFYGCKHFSRTNEYLSKCNLSEIDWNFLPNCDDGLRRNE